MNARRRAGRRRLHAAALLLLALGLPACGARGAPLPPFRPSPPALGGLQVSQRGGTAVLELDRVMAAMPVEEGTVEIRSVQLLLYAERYAAMTPEILATALERERFERLEQAREATRAAERAAAERRARREAEAAAAEAGEEPPEAPAVPEEVPGDEADDADEEGEELTENERLIRGVPDDVLSMWRDADLRGAVILESARRLDDTVDRLWTRVGMPVAIVDTEEPPALPDPVAIVEAARDVAETVSYERRMPSPEFLGLAAPVRELSMEELQGDETLGGDRTLIEYGVGIPSSGPLRTRYFFAVRAISSAGEEGALSDIVALAPAPVPVAPGAAAATVVEDGVELSWRASAGDVWGRLLEPEAVGYNVYRRLASQERFGRRPIHDAPLEEPEHLDEGVSWGESYVYEVRALRLDPDPEADEGEGTTSTIRRESVGVVTEEVAAVDVFPPDPPRAPEALRAGSRTTLRWTPPVQDDDVAGYRVWRHPLPAPELPGDLLPEGDTRAPGAGESPRTEGAQPEAEDGPDDGQEGAEAAAEAATDVAPQEGAAGPEAAAPDAGEDAAAPEADAGKGDPEQRPDHPDRVRRRVLERLGFELLTGRPEQATRYIDTATDPATGYVYLIEALDDAGNVSPVVRLEVPGAEGDG